MAYRPEFISHVEEAQRQELSELRNEVCENAREISRLKSELQTVTAERDRQYDENIHRIAEQARVEDERDQLLSDSVDKAEAWDAIAAKNAEIARLTAERDTARAETAMAFEVAATHYENGFPAWDVFGQFIRECRALTPANAKAALAARDKAIREQALRECVAYHQGEIDRLDAQIADNEAYMKRSGREVSEANKYCRDHQNSHRIARDAILALI